MVVNHEWHGFIRSKAGSNFLKFACLCAVLAAAVGYTVYHFSVTAFTATKSEEKITALQLIDAFVTNYSDARAQFGAGEAPVPATFRAHSIDLFNKARIGDDVLRLRWVGRVGREIASPPADARMSETIEAFAHEPSPKPRSMFEHVDGRLVFRTLYPSVATQQSCVDCHNKMTPDKPRWSLNDVMGAFSIDVPAGPFFRSTLIYSVSLALMIFLTATGFGFFISILHFRQLSERRTAYEALRVAKEEAETAQRQAEIANKAKSEFLATMSHELRTPLNAVIGFSQIMMSQTLGPIGSPQYGGYAKDINQSGTHLLEIINDILDLSKAEAGKLELDEGWVDVKSAVHAACRLIAPRAERAGLRIVQRLPADLPDLWADERKLKQILLNLLSNAVKFTSAGGDVQILASFDARSGLTLLVKDTGVGIAPEDLGRILEPFVQVENSFTRSHQGSGLGLPLAAKMTELHGGKLSIESELGKGTSVVLAFPAERTAESMRAVS